MATAFAHRVYAIVPVTVITAAFRTFWTGQIDVADDPATWPGLSATGSAPATHRHWCGSLVNADAVKVLNKWYAAASMTAPTWNGMTRAQIRARLASDRAALVAGSGIRMFHCDNDSTWDDFAALLTAAGLKVIAAAA